MQNLLLELYRYLEKEGWYQLDAVDRIGWACLVILFVCLLFAD